MSEINNSTMADQRGEQLRQYFALMVPRCIFDLVRRGVTDASEESRRLYGDPEFMDRLTYCEDMLHAPFDQDRRNSKLAYAEVIAAMSLMPGGVDAWGLHFEASCATSHETESVSGIQ